MPFQRPSLTERIAQVAADIEAELPGADALLRRSSLGAIGKAVAGLAYEHDGFLDWIARMSVPWTAEDECLDAWGAMKGVFRKVATAASGNVTFYGVENTVLLAGKTLADGNGQSYLTTDGGTILAGKVVVPATCTTSGAAGNIVAGTTLSLAIPVAGIQSAGVSGNFAAGADAEPDDELRARTIAAWQVLPQGGSAADYVGWALAVPGVTRAWVNPSGFGPGTVVIYAMMDEAQAAHGGRPQGLNGAATAETRESAKATGDLLAIANAIYPLQPVTAQVLVCAPIASPTNFVISGIASSTTSERAAISAAMADVFRRTAKPTGGIVALSDIESAIAAISGTQGFVILSPAGNIPGVIGFLPTLGTVAYQ